MPNAADSTPPSEFQGLIESLRREAVETAETEAARILASAEKRAAEILATARKSAEDIVTTAEREARRNEEASRDALHRASRDVLLSLESALAARLDAVLLRKTVETLRSDLLAEAIRALVDRWAPHEESPVFEILLSHDDLAQLEESALAALRDSLAAETHFRPVPDVDAGLRIGRHEEAVHYDFSAQTLAEWMGRFLTPRMREKLREVVETPAAGPDSAQPGNEE